MNLNDTCCTQNVMEKCDIGYCKKYITHFSSLYPFGYLHCSLPPLFYGSECSTSIIIITLHYHYWSTINFLNSESKVLSLRCLELFFVWYQSKFNIEIILNFEQNEEFLCYTTMFVRFHCEQLFR